MASAPILPVEWLVTRELVPYEAACALMAQRVDAIAAGKAAGARLAARASAALHGRHQRQGRRPDRARALSGASHRPRRPVHLSRARPARRLRHARRASAAGGDVRAFVAALETLVIDTLAALGVEANARSGRVGVWVRRPRRATERRGQDRGHRRAAAPLGQLARLQPQRGARPRALLRHRAVRHPRRRGDEPRRARVWPRVDGSVDGALRAAFERRFGPTCDAAARLRGCRRTEPRPGLRRDSEKKSAALPDVTGGRREDQEQDPPSPWCPACWLARRRAAARPAYRACRSRGCRPRSTRRRRLRAGTRPLRVVETNGAPFGADAIEHLRGLEDVVRLGIALDDRHLVIVIVAVGDRHRVGRGAARQEPDHANHTRKTHRRDQTQRVHPSRPLLLLLLRRLLLRCLLRGLLRLHRLVLPL